MKGIVFTSDKDQQLIGREVTYDQDSFDPADLLGSKSVSCIHVGRACKHGYNLRLYYNDCPQKKTPVNVYGSFIASAVIQGDMLMIDNKKNIVPNDVNVISTLFINEGKQAKK